MRQRVVARVAEFALDHPRIGGLRTAALAQGAPYAGTEQHQQAHGDADHQQHQQQDDPEQGHQHPHQRMAGTTRGEARLQAVRERVSALVGQNAIDDCDPTDLVQQIMDSGADDRVGVMMMSEIRIRALRDPGFGAAYLAQEDEMVGSIAAIIQEIVDTGQITLRIGAEEAARLLMIVWEGMIVRGAMSGEDSDRLRRTGSEALGRIVELIRL